MSSNTPAPATASTPLYSHFRFVPSNGAVAGAKRQIAARACERCRKRKKRCDHASQDNRHSALAGAPHRDDEQHIAHSSSIPKDSGQAQDELHFAGQGADSGSPLDRPQKRVKSTTSHLTRERFIGDLNPEAELIEASSPAAPRGLLTNRIGLWHNEETGDQTESASGFNLFNSASLFHGVPQEVRRLITPILEEQTLAVRPASEHMKAMEAFYIEHVHPVLPCIDLDQYFASPVDGPIRIMQEQLICLLAAPNPSMKPHLRLGENNHGPAEFAQILLGAIRLSLELATVPDVVVVIRALVVISLMSCGQHNLEFTSGFFPRAVHLAYTIGVHQPRDAERDQKVADLFCLLWAVDRMHAAIHGRPVLMHAVDMAKTPADCSQLSSPGFRTLVHIAILLDNVIALYRPNAEETEISDSDFLTFEEILNICGSECLSSNAMGTLELFYHGVAILSVRHQPEICSRPWTSRNSRQTASVLQIVSIMDQKVVGDVTLLPFVPYAASLALSAALRDMRRSTAATKQERARDHASKCCRYLRVLGDSYWSAACMAEMASKIIERAQRSVTTNSGNTPMEPDYDQPFADSVEPARSSVLAGESLGFLDTHWNIQDLEGILENNLDLSVPSLFRDQELFTLPS